MTATKASTLTNDLAAFVGAGGAVYLAGVSGTFSPATPAGDAAYWQPFLSAATGTSDFGLSGSDAWIALAPPLSFAGPVGTGVTNLDWSYVFPTPLSSSPQTFFRVREP